MSKIHIAIVRLLILTCGVEREKVVTVEELRVLTFLPLPDEDVIEGVVDVVLDDDEELLVPVPVDPHPPPRLVEGAGGVCELEVPRPRVPRHPLHRHRVLVRHVQPPQLEPSHRIFVSIIKHLLRPLYYLPCTMFLRIWTPLWNIFCQLVAASAVSTWCSLSPHQASRPESSVFT